MGALAGLFGFIPGWIWALICAGAIATSCTQGARLDREKAHHAATKTAFAEYRSEIDRQRAEASEKARQKEQELSHAVQEAQAQAEAVREQLDAARAAGRVAAQRLRDAAATASLAASAQCAGATAAAVSETAARAARVLADVLAEIDERSGVLAETADRSRAAGLQCEALHDAAVNATR